MSARLFRAVDELFAAAVNEPRRWDEAALAEWAQEAETDVASRDVARALRRCVRAAAKLAAFWRDPPPGIPDDHGDWRTRVDLALGLRAWRPSLELGTVILERSPDAELFAAVAERFRVVHGTDFGGGADYETWLEQRPDTAMTDG